MTNEALMQTTTLMETAAAELRRLHAQRDALLAALRKHVYLHDKDCVCEDCAAIKAVEENRCLGN